MERVVADTALMTAYGFSGNRATAITASRSDSLSSTKMNVKMYAEVYRLYGWISPTKERASYPVRFTLTGACAATSDVGAVELLKQALLGYVHPTQVNPKAKFTEVSRFFPLALQCLDDLGGLMYKHELCIGPMSFSESGPESYEEMINRIQNTRGDYSRLVKEYESLANSLGMKPQSVDNMTRLPISLLSGVGWVDTGVRDQSLYKKRLKCIRITELGREALHDTKRMVDIRLNDYLLASADERAALTKLGEYSMLLRAGFALNDEAVRIEIDHNRSLLSSRVGDRELLFSPYQSLRASEVDPTLGIVHGSQPIDSKDSWSSQDKTSLATSWPSENDLVLRLSKEALERSAIRVQTVRQSERSIRERIRALADGGLDQRQIVDTIRCEHASDKQQDFYPFVADLFTIVGVPCRESRAGDNGARWDAIAVDSKETVPIEIKSPTEERHLSLKAIRQALENKVVLLSRRTYPTQLVTTSLAVGFELPNNRAEVKMLIAEVKEAFGLSIGVVGLSDLLALAVKAELDMVMPDAARIRSLEGVLDVVL